MSARKKPDFAALLDQSEAKEIERIAAAHGIARRIALATVARSADQLLTNLNQEGAGDVLMESYERIHDFIEWRKTEAELLKVAQARILVILKHHDPAVARGFLHDLRCKGAGK